MIGYAMAKRNRRELARRWPEHNRRRHPEGGHEKLCGKCQEWLPMDEGFFSFIPAQGHYRSWCLFCGAEAIRLHRKARKVAA